MTWEELPDHARVWIYSASRQLSDEEQAKLRQHLSRFTAQWTAHRKDLAAFGDVWHGRFVLLAVDESRAGASGCSIDASVHFLQQLGRELDVDFFDRMTFFADAGNGFRAYTKEAFEEAYKRGELTAETLVVDPLVDSKRRVNQEFVKPLRESWHARFI